MKKIKQKMRRLRAKIFSKFVAHDLKALARLARTDKWGAHRYAQHYATHFQCFRKKRLNILEIGVGGYDNPKYGGESLRMWKNYFPKAMIYAIDIYEKSAHQEERIKIFQGSQANEAFLKDVCEKTGPLDIIIDDGSHVNEHVITSFKVLFPLLKNGGIYAVEDTQTSYWPRMGTDELGGDSENVNNRNTTMGFFKSLVDGLNHSEYLKPDYQPTYFDKHIVSISFYHNLIFVYKGLNDEGSNLVENGVLK
jgi:hypothetical protein